MSFGRRSNEWKRGAYRSAGAEQPVRSGPKDADLRSAGSAYRRAGANERSTSSAAPRVNPSYRRAGEGRPPGRVSSRWVMDGNGRWTRGG